MKKLLVLALVLSMATLANAGLQIVGAPTGDVLTGTVVTIGIDSDLAIAAGAGDGYWALVATVVVEDLTSGASAVIAESGFIIDKTDTAANLWGGLLPAGLGDGVSGAMLLVDTATQGPGAIYTGFVFNTPVVGDAVITLLYSATGEVADIVSSASFKVIPEPMTLGLLGLGGLFLRRRSK